MGIPIEGATAAGGDTVSYAIAIEESTWIDSSVAITVAAHTSLDDAHPPVRLGRAEGTASRPGVGPAARGVRPHRARRAPTRARREPRPSFVTAPGSSTARRCSSRTPAPTSRGATLTARTGTTRCRTSSSRMAHRDTRSRRRCTSSAGSLRHARELTFSGCEVPEGNLLGPRGKGFHQFLEILDGGRTPSRRWASALPRAPTTSRSRTRTSGHSSAPIELPGFLQACGHGGRDQAGRQLPVYRAAWLKDQGLLRARGRDGEVRAPASFSTGWSTTRSRSTVATGLWTSSRSPASTATRRSSRSARHQRGAAVGPQSTWL